MFVYFIITTQFHLDSENNTFLLSSLVPSTMSHTSTNSKKTPIFRAAKTARQASLTQNGFSIYPSEIGVPETNTNLAMDDLTQTQYLSQDSGVSSSKVSYRTHREDDDSESCMLICVNESPLKRVKLSPSVQMDDDYEKEEALAVAETMILKPQKTKVEDLDDFIPTSLYKMRQTLGESYQGKIRMPNYTEYLKCPVYITHVNNVLADKIQVWRKKTLRMLQDLKAKGNNNYPRVAYMPQYNWAKEDVGNMVFALREFKLCPVHILNKQAIAEVIPGCDDDEKATFVKKMANCLLWEIIYSPFKEHHNFFLYTKFNDNPKRKFAFGKSDGIADLSNLPRASRM